MGIARRPGPVAWSGEEEPARAAEEIEFSWAGETSRHVGTLVHRWLQAMGENPAQGWNRERIAALQPSFKAELAGLGVPREEIAGAVERVSAALAQTLEDERGRWLLGPHPQARCELRLTGVLDGKRVDAVMDRTFVDEKGVRWIVDYKTGAHEGAGVEGFLDRERERYSAQLARYAALMRGLDERPVRLGLYFPLLKGWREW